MATFEEMRKIGYGISGSSLAFSDKMWRKFIEIEKRIEKLEAEK